MADHSSGVGREQDHLATTPVRFWAPPDRLLCVAACAAVYGRSGGDGFGSMAAVVLQGEDVVAVSTYEA